MPLVFNIFWENSMQLQLNIFVQILKMRFSRREREREIKNKQIELGFLVTF